MIVINTLNISSFLNSAWPILVAILVFLIMIAIHEFGHFIAARLVGVKVNEFAIGFGPTIWKRQGKETKYAVRAFPIGGFCALEGEDDESDDSRAFCNQKPLKRLIIIVAGAFFNILLGFLIVMIIASMSKVYAGTSIAKFSDNSVSSNYGLNVGDEIIKVDGRRIFTTYDLSYAFSGVKGDTVDLTVKRDGEKLTLNNVKFDTFKQDGINYIKVDFWVNGVKRNIKTFFTQSLKTTASFSRIVWFSLVDLISGKYNISSVSGPVGVTVAIGEAAKYGLEELLQIIALITINLGIFNMLPLPALDGGRAFFILVEMIIRKPINKKREALVHTIGIVCLLLFAAFITAKDIYKLFT